MKHDRNHELKYCMWGEIDHCEQVAEGIWAVSTPSHGGLVLSHEREQQFRKIMPGWCSAYSTTREFEEDCDCLAVVLAFPECFPDRTVEKAVEEASGTDYFPNRYAYGVYMDRQGVRT